jgi:hypothetical protein
MFLRGVFILQTCVEDERFIERCNVPKEKNAVKEAQEVGSPRN